MGRLSTTECTYLPTYTSTREHGIQTCRQLQGLLKRVCILSTQSLPMGLWIARPNFWSNFYPDLKTRM